MRSPHEIRIDEISAIQRMLNRLYASVNAIDDHGARVGIRMSIGALGERKRKVRALHLKMKEEGKREQRELAKPGPPSWSGTAPAIQCPSMHGGQQCMRAAGHKGPHAEGKEVWLHD